MCICACLLRGTLLHDGVPRFGDRRRYFWNVCLPGRPPLKDNILTLRKPTTRFCERPVCIPTSEPANYANEPLHHLMYLPSILHVFVMYLVCSWRVFVVYLICNWRIFGVYLTCIWYVFSVYLACIRDIFAVYLAYIWNVFGMHLRCIWHAFGVYLVCI